MRELLMQHKNAYVLLFHYILTKKRNGLTHINSGHTTVQTLVTVTSALSIIRIFYASA